MNKLFIEKMNFCFYVVRDLSFAFVTILNGNTCTIYVWYDIFFM
jgi:hypothetical protein